MASVWDFAKMDKAGKLADTLVRLRAYLTTVNSYSAISFKQLTMLVNKINGGIAAITGFTSEHAAWLTANYEAEDTIIDDTLTKLETLRDALVPIYATAKSDLDDALARFRADVVAEYASNSIAYLNDPDRPEFEEPVEMIDVDAVKLLVTAALEADPILVV